VLVRDTTAPRITAPRDIIVEATGAATRVATGAPVTNDIFAVTVTNNAPSLFALGTTTVTWVAQDTNGNRSTASQLVTVQDTTPPEITVVRISGRSEYLSDGHYWANKPVVIYFKVNDKVDSTPTITASAGVLDANAGTVTLPANQWYGDCTITISAKDDYGNTRNTRVVVTLVLAGGLSVKPETFSRSQTVPVTARLTLPKAFDITTISDVTCNGSTVPGVRTNKKKNEAVITLLPRYIMIIGNRFTIIGTVQYNGRRIPFAATDTVMMVYK
jgi:hypothetical protein